nr:MAG TPA: hypothetical protein [Caudoviricetes sp.]
MRGHLAEEFEEFTDERFERLRDELEWRKKMRAVAKGCCLWLGGAASALAIVAGHMNLDAATMMHGLALVSMALGILL